MDQFYNKNPAGAPGDESATQRNDVRDSLFLVAQFRLFGSERESQVRIRNLSSGGLMAEYAEPISIGAPVEVEVRGIGWILGRIAWAAAGRVGIAFEHPIDPKLARKPVGGGERTPTFVKPILPRR